MNINIDINKFLQSKKFKIVILGIAGLIILLLAFGAGTFVGFKKANFSYKWGENYHQNFAGPRGGFFKEFERELEGRDFINAHGIIGQIIKIDPSASTSAMSSVPNGSGQAATLIIKGKDNIEKIILVKENTVIMRFKETIKVAELKTDELIVVIGEPNDSGQIEAKLIRIMPTPSVLPPSLPLK